MGLAQRSYMAPVSPAQSMPRRPRAFGNLLLLLLFLLLVAGSWVADNAHRLPSPLNTLLPVSAMPFPPNGTAAYPESGRPRPEAVPFGIRDSSGEGLYRVIRFRSPSRAGLAAELYLHPGGEGRVLLPPGFYRVHVMQGSSWRGPADHFGRGAETFDFGSVTVGADMAGFTILPRSPVGNAMPMSGARF